MAMNFKIWSGYKLSLFVNLWVITSQWCAVMSVCLCTARQYTLTFPSSSSGSEKYPEIFLTHLFYSLGRIQHSSPEATKNLPLLALYRVVVCTDTLLLLLLFFFFFLTKAILPAASLEHADAGILLFFDQLASHPAFKKKIGRHQLYLRPPQSLTTWMLSFLNYWANGGSSPCWL